MIEQIIQKEMGSKMKSKEEFEIEEKEIETILIAGYRMNGKYSDVGKGFGILGRGLGKEINGRQ